MRPEASKRTPSRSSSARCSESEPGVDARTHAALRVHDAVPRDARAVRQRGHRVADQARVRRQTREARDLPVARDAPARDAPHHGVDASVECRRRSAGPRDEHRPRASYPRGVRRTGMILQPTCRSGARSPGRTALRPARRGPAVPRRGRPLPPVLLRAARRRAASAPASADCASSRAACATCAAARCCASRRTLPGDVARLRERLGARLVLEADIRFAYRYLIDLGIKSGVAIEGDPEALPNGVLCFRNPELAPASRAAVAALPVARSRDDARRERECSRGAWSGRASRKCIWSRPTPWRARTRIATRRGCCARWSSRIAALDPDVLIGWNVVDFDLRVLAARCAALGLAAELGRAAGCDRLPGGSRLHAPVARA